MYVRDLAPVLHRYAKFPVVALLGPRQSGKTTLVKHEFPDHVFLSLDDDVLRTFAIEDPEGFLLTHENAHGIILDEFQYAPSLTTYIKMEVDKKRRPGYFILTGSQNFLMNKAITESLAGRVGILNLFSLSINELHAHNLLSDSLEATMFYGGYPRIFTDELPPADFYMSYILSYVQRDIGSLVNPKNMSTFRRFVQLCAGRIGQLCNVSALAVEAGVSVPTAREWLSLLEASYILFFAEPHFKNFNKRLVKTPKLYFFDVGLACSLLRIDNAEVLSNSHFQGALFESFIMADFYKQFCNQGFRPEVYFWRDNSGAHEIDCILDMNGTSYPIEIKSGKTVTSEFFRGIDYWNNLAQAQSDNSYIVYAGEQKQLRKQATVLGWKDIKDLVGVLKGAQLPLKI